jgi:catechol 2,3-dioxygenase-like lactoylglutathione lyase family enzyme
MTDQGPNQPNVQEAVPFFRVADIQASVRFYVDGLGCTMTHQWTPKGRLQWCRLQLGNAALMLQEKRPPWDDPGKPSGKLGDGVSIPFMCRDAVAIYRELKSRGLNASRPFVGNGLWVTLISDPDGYKLEFESPTDAPEESVYQGE